MESEVPCMSLSAQETFTNTCLQESSRTSVTRRDVGMGPRRTGGARNSIAHRNELVEYSLALDLLIMQPCLHERAAKDEQKRDPNDGEEADSLLHPFPICNTIPSHIWPICYDCQMHSFSLPHKKAKGRSQTIPSPLSPFLCVFEADS